MNQSIGIGDITNDYLYLSSDTNQLQIDHQSIDKIVTTQQLSVGSVTGKIFLIWTNVT